MNRAFIVQRSYAHHEKNRLVDLAEQCKKEKPNKVFIISLGEINVKYDYHYFFESIQGWLIENDVPCYVLWAGPNLELYPKIYGVNTLGSAVGNWYCSEGASRASRRINLVETADKLFTCYNNNCKLERKILVDLIVKNNLLKDGIVTYHYPESLSQQYKWKYHNGSRLVDEPDYKISAKPEYSPGLLPASYFKGMIDIICETDCQEGYFIPTEKNAKAWGAGKPYLVLTSVNYHKWLFDEYGIEPYTEVFDYGFDKKKNIQDRINGIIDNLLYWQKEFNANPTAKEKFYEKVKEKINNNRKTAKLILKTLKLKNKVIPECLKFITTEPYVLLGESTNSGGGLHFYFDPEWHKQYG